MTRFLRAKLAYEIALPALIAFAVFAAGGAAPSFAQSLQKVDQQLDQLENQLSEQQKQEEFLSRKSRELWTEEQALQSEAISVARRAQRLETTLTDLEDQLENLEAREKVAATSLEDKAGQYARILMALQRLSTTPPEAVIALPTSPQDTLRSAVLLKAALPGVEQHARDLRKELGEIATLREDIRNRRSELAAATQELQQERASLSALLDEKRRLRAQTEAEAEEAAKAVSALADEAKSLGELLRNLQNRAERLAIQLATFPWVSGAKAVAEEAYLGGGSVPTQQLTSWCVSLEIQQNGVSDLARRLRIGCPAVVGRVQRNQLLLDLRAVFPQQDMLIVEAFEKIGSAGNGNSVSQEPHDHSDEN